MREPEILPGTFCERMKSAWKGAEVKDTFLPGTFMKSSVPNSSDGLIFVKRQAKDMFPGTN